MHNYQAMTDRQLAALVRQFHRSATELDCEFGHPACGCSTVKTANGRAACFDKVRDEQARRFAWKKLRDKTFTEGEPSHVVIVRNEQPETQTPCLWFGILRSDAESDSRVLLCESLNGHRVSEQSFTAEEWQTLRKAILGGVL